MSTETFLCGICTPTKYNVDFWFDCPHEEVLPYPIIHDGLIAVGLMMFMTSVPFVLNAAFFFLYTHHILPSFVEQFIDMIVNEEGAITDGEE